MINQPSQVPTATRVVFGLKGATWAGLSSTCLLQGMMQQLVWPLPTWRPVNYRNYKTFYEQIIVPNAMLSKTNFFLITCCTYYCRTFAFMKWLTIILSVYLLGLSFWPCADEPSLTSGQAAMAMISSIATESERSHHHEHDACSPFCTCSCCAATITVFPHFSYSLLPSVEMIPIDVATFHYVSAPLSDTLTAIWQPPKLRV